MDLENHKNGKKPKIAILHFSAPPKISGVDRMIKDQSRLLRLHGYKVELLAGVGKQFRKDINVRIFRKIDPINPLVLRVRKELEKGIVSKDFARLEKSLYNSLKKHFLTQDIDVCIVHNVMTRYYNLALSSAITKLSKDLPNIRFLVWVHDISFYKDPYRPLSKNLADNFPWNLLVTPNKKFYYVCVSNFLKKDLKNTFIENNQNPNNANITVIPNMYDIPKFLGLSPYMRQFYEYIDGINSDYIGVVPVRAIPRKNLELAIAITSEIIKKNINFKLILTANVDYKLPENKIYYDKIKKLVSDLKLQKNVFFLEEFFESISDKKTQIPIPEVYLISDFLLLTSTIEGFGLPLIEAGLLRCPIFVGDIPPFREIGTTNINYFSLTDSPIDVAEMILRKIQKIPQAYFYRKIIRNYSPSVLFKEKILPLLEELDL